MLKSFNFERFNLYLRTSLFQSKSGFQSNLSDQAKLGPLIVKVCKCFTTEKQIFRYNQIIARTAGYHTLNLKNPGYKRMAMNYKAAVFQRLKYNISIDRHEGAAGKLYCPHRSILPDDRALKVKYAGRVKL